jgi:hypothetical protein
MQNGRCGWKRFAGYTFWTGGSDVVPLVRLKATYLSSFSYQREWKERSSFQVNAVAIRLL